jgi:hypothetical protein
MLGKLLDVIKLKAAYGDLPQVTERTVKSKPQSRQCASGNITRTELFCLFQDRTSHYAPIDRRRRKFACGPFAENIHFLEI